MSVITAISPLPSRQKTAAVRVDGRIVAKLSSAGIEALGLHEGQAWDEALGQRVAERAAYEAALHQATRWLDRRMLSRSQVRGKLADAGHAKPAMDRVLERLAELGLVDDAKLGRTLIEQLQRQRAAGPELVRERLAARGLDDATIDRLLEAAAGDVPTQVEQARELARQQLVKNPRGDVPTRYRRIAGLLARRGFDADVIEQAITGMPEFEMDRMD
ncbi:MAG: RecX family transcriptional regulator [Phycisphaeraceae bacterium]